MSFEGIHANHKYASWAQPFGKCTDGDWHDWKQIETAWSDYDEPPHQMDSTGPCLWCKYRCAKCGVQTGWVKG